MRKNFASKPYLFPMPVAIVAAYDENGTPCAMNAAWAQICDMGEIALFISKGHKTTQNILQTKAFTVSIADVPHMAEADFLGIASGNEMPDKFARSGLHEVKSEFVNAPVIPEFPVTMECELTEVAETKAIYAIVGHIVNVSAEERVLDDKGKIDPKKLQALVFDQFQNGYYTVGDQVGQAWHAGMGLMKK